MIWDTVNRERNSTNRTTHLLRIPADGRLTSGLFSSMVEELKLGVTVLQMKLVIREGMEPRTSNSKSYFERSY